MRASVDNPKPRKNWTASIMHSEEHFNTRAQATVPEYWEATLLSYPANDNDAARALEGGPGCHINIYGTSQKDANDALLDLLKELEHMHFAGTLHITNACICEQCTPHELRGSRHNFGTRQHE